MARMLSTVVVVALLVGTAAAFALTERLKLVPSPITAPRITKVFSPVCECDTDSARLRFRLREGDRVTATIVDAGGDPVRSLERRERFPAGEVELAWDGRDEAGAVVPEGTYRLRVHLDRQRRTIVLPNPIEVDTTAPEVEVRAVQPQTFSPDGDGNADKVTVRYAVSEPANALLFVEGERRVRTRFAPLQGKLDWFGIVEGDPVRAGTYALRLVAEDRAGNRSQRTEPVDVRVRYVELAREVVTVPVGFRFGIGVGTDAGSYRWRFAGGTGRADGDVLVLRAPRRPGRFTVFVEANGRADRAEVVVVPRGD